MLVSKAQQRINGLIGFCVLSLLGAVVSTVTTPTPVAAKTYRAQIVQVCDMAPTTEKVVFIQVRNGSNEVTVTN